MKVTGDSFSLFNLFSLVVYCLVMGFILLLPRNTAQAQEDYDSSYIWNPPDGVLPKIQECINDTYYDCLLESMREEGASAEALAFTEMLDGYGYMLGFEEKGLVDIAYVIYPYRVNGNSQTLLLNGSPSVIHIDAIDLPDEVIRADQRYPELARQHPDWLFWAWDNGFSSMEDLPSGGQRFIFSYSLYSGCHACGQAGMVGVAYDFDQQGNFLGTQFLGITTIIRGKELDLSFDLNQVLKDKNEAIQYLSSPPIDVIGLTLKPPENKLWGNAETEQGAKDILNQIETDYDLYQTNELGIEEIIAFEERAEKFGRLALAEQGMMGLYPQFAQMTYDLAESMINVIGAAMSLAEKVEFVANLIAERTGKEIIRSIGAEMNKEILDSIQHMIEIYAKRLDNETFREGYLLTASLVFPTLKSAFDEGQSFREILIDYPLRGGISGGTLAWYFHVTDPNLKMAVNSAKADYQDGDILPMTGSFDRAKNLTDEVVQLAGFQTDLQHSNHQDFVKAADWMKVASDIGDLASLANAPFGQFAARTADLFGALASGFDGFKLARHMGDLLEDNREIVTLAFDAAARPREESYRGNRALFSRRSPTNWASTYPPANSHWLQAEDSAYTKALEETMAAVRAGGEQELTENIHQLFAVTHELDNQLDITREQLLLSDDLQDEEEAQLLQDRLSLSSQRIRLYGYLADNILNPGNDEIITQAEQEAAQLLVDTQNARSAAETISHKISRTDLPASIIVLVRDIPKQIYANQQFDISIQLLNIGNTSATDVAVQITGNSTIPINERITIGEIDSQETLNIAFTLKPPTPGIALVTIDASNKEDVTDSANLIFSVQEITTPKTSSYPADESSSKSVKDDADISQKQITEAYNPSWLLVGGVVLFGFAFVIAALFIRRIT